MSTPRTLVGLSGFGRSGKDSAAQGLLVRGWTRRSFAEPMRQTTYAMNPWLPDGRRYAEVFDSVGYELAKDTVPGFRDALIGLGHGARLHIGPDVWIDAALRCLDRKDPRVVLPDTRYRNEADAIRERGGLVVRIERPGVGPAVDHPSETELIDYDFDAVIVNDGPLDQLGSVLAARLMTLGLRVGEPSPRH